MTNRRLNESSILLLLGAALWAGCASGGAGAGQLAAEALFERGLKEYQARDWTDAIRLLERLTLEYPTHPRLQEARFYLADSYFHKKEYVTAATEFVRVATDFPTGAYADDARFKVCDAYRLLSPDVQRDQQYTRAAIEHCRSLVAYFPSSEYVPRAQEIIRGMEEKLAEKVLIGGEFYYRRRAYDSAIIYFEDLVRQYPRAAAAPRALLRLVQAYRQIGYLDEAEAARQRLLKEYPGSAEAKQVEQISLASSP